MYSMWILFTFSILMMISACLVGTYISHKRFPPWVDEWANRVFYIGGLLIIVAITWILVNLITQKKTYKVDLPEEFRASDDGHDMEATIRGDTVYLYFKSD